MFTTMKTDVLVVGAGPVGLFLAVQLAERGVEVAVIDRERRTNIHSYALALHPLTLRMLGECGLLDAVLADAHLVRRVIFLEGRDERLVVDYNDLETEHPYVAVVPQSTLESVLEESLRWRNVKVLWHHELSELDSHWADEVIAETQHFADVPQGYPILEPHRMVVGRRKIRARFVIGADGFHSTVRSLSGIRYLSRGPATSFSLYEFGTEQELGPDARVACAGSSYSVLWPLKGGRCRWGFVIDEPGEHRPDLRGLEQLAGERAPWFSGFPKRLDWTACVRFEPHTAEAAGRGRVWLAGDAAHLTSPIGAQSMNVGMVEARELAVRLTEVLRQSVPIESMENYAAGRRKEWATLLDPASWELTTMANDWVRRHAAHLPPLVPASGADLAVLLRHAGLAPATG